METRVLEDLLVSAREELLEREEYIPLSLANEEYIRISNEIPQGQKAFEISTYTRLGRAAIAVSNATGVPVTNRVTRTELVKVFPIVVGFEVTFDDIETAEAAGANIVAENLIDNQDAAEQELDIISYVGAAGTSLKGFANFPGLTRIDFPEDGTGASASWEDKTPDQVLRDLNILAYKVPEQTGLTKFVNRILLPASKWISINSRPYNTLSGDTILATFLKNQSRTNGVTEVIGHPVLEDLGDDGAGLAIAYNTRSTGNRLHIPQGGEFQDMPYSLNGRTWTVPCQMKTGGIEIRRTLEVVQANLV